jgi:glycerol-3-phosphate dehydrogenase
MKRNLQRLQDELFDLLVIGGGITGAGVALDATLRGYRVALIDKGDFASGTSSVSSKLVHGGLRYLEHGEFRLVYEALQERRLLLQNAPHLVKPLRFVIPFYHGSRVPPWKWRTGLALYDVLAGRANLQRSRSLPTRTLLREFPGLKSPGLTGGGSYFDAQMDDARLCLDVVQTAAEHGACVANYVEAVGFDVAGGKITGAHVRDHVSGSKWLLRAAQCLNAAGPWVDSVCRLAGDNSGPHLSPTKGVHVVVPGRQLSAAFLLLHPDDGRVFFVIPWMGKTLIGTTDTLCNDRPEDLHVAESEIDYILRGHNHYFCPEATRADVLGSFAGLRPLIAAKTDQPSAISREYQVFTSPSGLVSVAGGKYTTYRHMAEVVTDVLAKRLGTRGRCRTQRCRLIGAMNRADSSPQEQGRRLGLTESSITHLVGRYGAQATAVMAYIQNDPGLAQSIVENEADMLAEIAYQREHEMALYSADHFLRRSRLGLLHPKAAPRMTAQK